MKFEQLEKLNIIYKVTKSKRRTMAFRFLSNGTVNIIIPYRYNQTMADIIVNKYLDKIVERVNYRKELIASYNDNEDFLYLGKKYKIKVIESKYPKIILDDSTMYLYTKVNDFKVKEKLIYEYLYDNAQDVFNELLYQVFNQMKNHLATYPNLEIKKFKSVWGLCRIKRNTIALNVDLMHVDIECIKYVICHELCHFVYPNHQKEFHILLNQFINEKELKKRLKEYKFKK